VVPPRIYGQHTLRVPQVQGHDVTLTPGRVSYTTTSSTSMVAGKRVEAVARWREWWTGERGGPQTYAAKHYSAEPREPLGHAADMAQNAAVLLEEIDKMRLRRLDKRFRQEAGSGDDPIVQRSLSK